MTFIKWLSQKYSVEISNGKSDINKAVGEQGATSMDHEGLSRSLWIDIFNHLVVINVENRNWAMLNLKMTLAMLHCQK
jgi:hypothetical protein